MRIIDADALIEKWYEVNNIGPEDRGARFIGYTEIPRFINNAPTVQPTGDLISRADAVKAIRKCKFESVMPSDWYRGMECAQDIVEELPSAEAEQVTGKLKNPCDSLLTDDSAECKEHKSKLESADTNQTNSRLIGANALMDLLKARKRFFIDAYGGFHYMSEKDKARCDEIDACIASIVNAPTASADAVQGWIPVSERLPETHTEYVTENPWMQVTVGEDTYQLSDAVLGYGRRKHHSKDDPMMSVVWYEDDGEGRTAWQTAPDCEDIEVIAWMPLPKPYREAGEE